MNISPHPGQVLFEVAGQVKFCNLSCGQQPWKDGCIEIIALADGQVNCCVKPKFGKMRKFKLGKSSLMNTTVNVNNLMMNLKEGGNIRIQTRDVHNQNKLQTVKKLLDIVMNGQFKPSETKGNHSFNISPTSSNADHRNIYQTPMKKQCENPMTTPTSKRDPYSDLDSDRSRSDLDSDIADREFPLFDMDKENVHYSGSQGQQESVYHRRKDLGNSLFIKSFEEKKKQPKTPTSKLKQKAVSFYSRGQQMLRAASHSFLESSATKRKPQLLGSPNKKPRLSDGVYKGWQEKCKLFTTSSNQPKLKGFSNLGNTCYMNAILQSLFSLEPFVNDIQNKRVFTDMPQESLYRAVGQLLQAKKKDRELDEIQRLLRSLKGAISNTATRFSGYLQHDAHEFLGQCLDQLKDEVLKLNKNAASFKDLENKPASRGAGDDRSSVTYPCAITRNFEFEVLHAIQCKKCREVITNSETCHDLSLDLPRMKDSAMKISIQTALDQFFQSEPLEYTCEECGCKESTVTHSFTKIPRVLIVQLKRYSFDVNEAHKLRQSILIPNYLTLSKHCNEESRPALRFSEDSNKAILMKPSMMSPGPVEPAEHQARKRLNYEDDSFAQDFPNGYSFKRKKLTEVSHDLDEEVLAGIDMTQENERKEDNTSEKGANNPPESKPIEEMSEDEQLAFVIEMSRQENAQKQKHSKDLSEEDQLAMVLEMSKQEATFMTSNNRRETCDIIRSSDVMSAQFNSSYTSMNKPDVILTNTNSSDCRLASIEGGVSLSNGGVGLPLNIDAMVTSPMNTGVPSNDIRISIDGIEPLCNSNGDLVTSPKGAELNHAHSQRNGGVDEIDSSQRADKETTKSVHNFTDERPLNVEDEAKALEQAMELSLQEFEKTNSRSWNSSKEDTDGIKEVEYTSEELEKLQKNYNTGEMPHSYKLLSIVSHIGSTSAIGHYVSDVYDEKKSDWYSYDDSEVVRTSARAVQEARQKNGYIFFYMHK